MHALTCCSDRSFPSSNLCLILQLERVNKNLEAYYDAWDKFIKAWIVIKIKDPSCVYQWRLQVNVINSTCFVRLFHAIELHVYTVLWGINLQAEIGMREAGKPGMSDEEVC